VTRKALLIVVEQFKRGGLETHIESEVRTLTALGWDVHLALSEFQSATALPPELKGILTGIDLGPLATSSQLLLVAETLGRYIERNAIVAVHCHPFTSSLAAFLAAGRSGVRLAFTLHGPASVGAHYGAVFETFFRRFILPQSGLVVCVSPEVAQLARLAGTSGATVVLPNPVRLGAIADRTQRGEGPLRIACASRLDEEKIAGIEDFIVKLPGDLDWQLDIMGSGQSEARLAAFIAASPFAARIAMRGWSDTLGEELVSYDLVAGMGRVVLEAAAADVPAVLVGYDGVKGLLDADAFRNAAYANFSGRGVATIEADELHAQLASLRSDVTERRLRHLVEAGFGETGVWSAFAAKLTKAAPSDRRAVDLLHHALSQTRDSTVPLLQNQTIIELLREQEERQDVVDEMGSGKVTVMPSGNHLVDAPHSGGRDVDVLLGELEALRSVLFALETRLEDEARGTALDEATKSFVSAGADLSTLRSQVAEIQAASAVHRAEMAVDRRTFERIEQDWRSLGMRLFEHVGAADAKMQALLAQAQQSAFQAFETKADERWTRFLDEIKLQHAREVTLIEREAERRAVLLSEQAAQATTRLEAAQGEIAKLSLALEAAVSRENEQAVLSREAWAAEEDRLRGQVAAACAEADRYQHEIDALKASFNAAHREALAQWSAQEADLMARLAAADARPVAREFLASPGDEHALQQIVSSLEAQGAVLKREILELRARAAVLDSPPPDRHPGDAPQPARYGIPGLVSIVLPVYNQANLIDEAIEGVLKQTYPHWELIIVDDGSKDDLHAVLAKYTADRRIRIASQPNQKLPSALNNGNFFVRGAYITWTSADNIMLPEQLSELVVALEANPGAGLAYSDYQAIDDRSAPLNDPDWRRHNRPDGSSMIRLPGTVTLENFHQSGDNFLGASFMWRADIQAIVGPYDESTFGGEDYDMWLRMHLVTEFVHVPKVLYQYRVHDNTLNAKAKELDLFKNIRLLLEMNQRRRETLLKEPKLLPGANGHLRDPRQYAVGVTANREFLTYFELVAKRAAGELLNDRVRVVTVDAPLRVLDLAVLADSDILVVPDALTFTWLRQQELPRHIRLLAGEMASIRTAVDHAIALRHFDRTLADEGHILARKPYAHPVARVGRDGIALLMQRWGIGGMEQVVLELAIGLAAKGARVSVCLVEASGHEHLSAHAKRHGFSVVALDGKVDRLVSHCRAENVQTVHYHHCSLGCRDLAGIGVRTVYTFHNSYVWLDERERAAHADAIAPMSAFIAVSREAAAFGRRAFNLNAPIFVVPNGTDIQAAGANVLGEAGASLPNPRAEQRFGFLAVGTLTPHKLHDRLIRAFGTVAAEVPGARLTVVGSAQDEGMFKRLLDLRNALPDPSACSVIPGVPRQDVIGLMRSHHCLVMPSLIEGWSISLMEAAIAGMVCIATDVGSARDLAQKTSSVVLAPSPGGDVLELDGERMWAAIQSPLKGFEAALASAMIDAAKRFDVLDAAAKAAAPALTQDFSLNAMIEAHLRVYQQI